MTCFMLKNTRLYKCCGLQMITDAAFGYLADKQLRSQAAVNGGNNYKYLFGFRPNATLEGEGVWNNTEWAGNTLVG